MSVEIEGVIKYEQLLSKWSNINHYQQQIEQLNTLRQELYRLKLIGIDNHGFGYGNISSRTTANQFIITASQTGHLPTLSHLDYAYVYQADLARQKLWARGEKRASSEALTHFALYDVHNSITHVAHIHCSEMWNYFLKQINTVKTPQDVEYGTAAMAQQMKTLYRKSTDRFILSGHQDGIIYFANDFNKLLNMILNDYNEVFN